MADRRWSEAEPRVPNVGVDPVAVDSVRYIALNDYLSISRRSNLPFMRVDLPVVEEREMIGAGACLDRLDDAEIHKRRDLGFLGIQQVLQAPGPLSL